MRRIRTWLTVSLLVIWCIPMAHGKDAPSPAPDQAWQVDADHLEYDQVNQEYVARGGVRISQAGYILTADQVRLNQRTRLATAEGNVRLQSGQDTMTGSRLSMDLDGQTGTLIDGDVFISANHLYLSGREIRKTGPQTYTAKKARLTSCDGDAPAWKVTGSDFEVTIEGYGTARHAALWAGKVPVIYSPYLVFPAKVKRQSGLLMPELETSDRKGTSIIQPLFWAISENSDATLYAHFMSERGVRNGLEYRYIADELTRGTLIAEGFNDRQVDDGTGDSTERWGYGDDAFLRPNEDRYWLRVKHDHGFDNGLSAKLDIDVVSDQDYLNEFRSGYNGFNETQTYFQETFGREIDDYNEPVRLNRFNLNRTWNRYAFNTDLRWYDDVIKRRTDAVNDTLQQLPEISFDGIKQPTGTTPFFHDLTSSYNYFYRVDGTRGHRLDLYPRIYYPFDLFGALSVEPSAGLRQTAWFVEQESPSPELDADRFDRTIYDFILDVSTEFYRIFDFTLAGSDRLKHALTPEIIYEYTPDQDQSELPDFNEVDRIERKNLVTYGINNTFTARSPQAAGGDTAAHSYTPFLRFKISQSFDINKDNESDPEPFSNILAELDLTPGRHVNLDTDAQWSVYDNRFEVLNTALTLWNSRGDRLTADYRYTRESDPQDDEPVEGVSTVSMYVETMLGSRWRVRAGHEHNLFDDRPIESRLGASYQSQCWGMDIDYRIERNDDRDNQSFTVMFNLLGLGSIGY